MTTALAVDTRDHLAAIKAAVNARLAPDWSTYSYGEAPGDARNPVESLRAAPIPYIYVLVAVSRRYQPPRRLTAQVGRSAWRLTARAVGRSVSEAEWALNRATLALDEASLAIAGQASTPLQFENATNPEWDEGRFSALTMFTYTI